MTNDSEELLITQRKLASLQSKGSSSDLILEEIISIFKEQSISKSARILDIGCGTGKLLSEIHNLNYLNLHGRDLVRFTNAPFINFEEIDCNGNFGNKDTAFEIVLSSEVIEHIENPRNFVREIKKSLAPKGIVILSTPNPESLASILSFVIRGYYGAFGPKDYPAHITAVTKYEMGHIFEEAGIELIQFIYVANGRIPGTAKRWKNILPFLKGKWFSDNYIIVGKSK